MLQTNGDEETICNYLLKRTITTRDGKERGRKRKGKVKEGKGKGIGLIRLGSLVQQEIISFIHYPMENILNSLNVHKTCIYVGKYNLDRQ